MNNLVTSHLSVRVRQRMILLLLLLNVIVIVAMSVVGVALKPYTIVDFELAGSVARTSDMLKLWKETGAMPALYFVLGFDYLFMLVYSVSLWFVCLHVAEVARSLTGFMITLAWLQPLAAVLDAMENAALFQIALGSENSFWPVLAWWSAVPKFVIALTAVLFWLALTFTGWYRRSVNSHP